MQIPLLAERCVLPNSMDYSGGSEESKGKGPFAQHAMPLDVGDPLISNFFTLTSDYQNECLCYTTVLSTMADP